MILPAFKTAPPEPSVALFESKTVLPLNTAVPCFNKEIAPLVFASFPVNVAPVLEINLPEERYIAPPNALSAKTLLFVNSAISEKITLPFCMLKAPPVPPCSTVVPVFEITST